MFLHVEGLDECDVVGSSLGGRIMLELARRGRVRSAIALDPGGFWHGWERHYVHASLLGTIKLIRGVGTKRRVLAKRAIRPLSLRQLCYDPLKLPGPFVACEIDRCARAGNFEAIIRDLTSIAFQIGPAASSVGSVAIGWGRQDRLCFPRHALRAQAAFPGSTLYWFDRCGHFPMWDQPDATAAFILKSLGQTSERERR